MFVSPTGTVFYSIEKAIKSYRKFAQKRISELVSDITLDQAQLLLLVEEKPRLSQVEMAEILFKDYASITRMIALLEQNGYLSKSDHPGDGRRSELRCTAKSKATLELLKPVILDNRARAIAGSKAEELEVMQKVLALIAENCREAWK